MNAMIETPVPKGIQESSVVAGATARPLVPTSFEGAFRIGQVLANSRMAPKGMETAEACTIAIMHGLEIGLMPMQAVQSIAVVNGRPTIWGDAAKALCISSAECEDIIETTEGDGDKMVAICTAKRRGKTPSVQRFSVEDAKKAGVWSKAGPWQQYPKRMLQLRARSFALRDAFPDVLKGLAIREEMEDVVEMRDITPPAPPSPPTPAVGGASAEAVMPMKKAAPPKAEAPAPQRAEEQKPAAEAPQPPTIDGEIIPPKKEAAPEQPKKSEAMALDDAQAGGPDPDTVARAEESLTLLAANLATAETAESVEEGYTFLDLEAEFGDVPGFVDKARHVKAKALDRIRDAQAMTAKKSGEMTPKDFEERFLEIVEGALTSDELNKASAFWNANPGIRQAITKDRKDELMMQYNDRNRQISNGELKP